MGRSVTDLMLPGGWHETTVSAGGHQFSLVVPANPDEFLEQLDTLSDRVGHADPYWARLWPTGVTMAHWILGRRWAAGQAAIELGCGLGLAGIAAMKMGLRVTFSDYVPAAVEVACENARRNGCRHPASAVFDWRQPPAGRKFPVVLGSDIVYEQEQHEPLLRLVDELLTQDGSCFLGDPGRYHVPAFEARARRRGYVVRRFAANGDAQERQRPGEFQLLELRRE